MQAIIPAAGLGTRFGSLTKDVPKAFLEVPGTGQSMLEITVGKLLDSGLVDEICIAVPDGFKERAEQLLRRGHVIVGGKTRQESVRLALEWTRAEFVLVHDAARPLTTTQDIQRVIKQARKNGAAILAAPATSTLKEVHGDTIKHTISRESIWEAQTPQVFRTSLLKHAHQEAKKANIQGTDDSELVEHLGKRVAIVRATTLNLKVTTPEDLKILTLFL